MSDTRTMKCVNCKDELINHYICTMEEEISYFICPSCESLWLPDGELDKMADDVEGSIEFSSTSEAEDTGEPLKECPSCEKTDLEKVFFLEYTNVLLDHCRHCEGFWLDAGELEKINEELKKIMPVKEKGYSNFINSIHMPYWKKRIWDFQGGTKVPERELPPIRHSEKLETSPYKCPACEEQMDLYEAYGIKFEGCTSCRGLWLDRDELRKLKDTAEQDSWTDLRWMDDEIETFRTAASMPSRRLCPKCDGEQLVSVQFGESRVLIDYCPGCNGTWLDRDEFLEIVQFLKEDLIDLSPDEVRERVKEELKEVWDGPEDTLSEILDAKASVSALINITIFGNPKLAKFLVSSSENMRNMGIV